MTLLLALLAGPALAFDVLKTDELTARFASVAARAGGTVLVAAAGVDADHALTRMKREDKDFPFQIERVPLMGDDDTIMARVLEANKASCGVRVAPGGDSDQWIVTEYGSCGQSAESEDSGWVPSADDPSGHHGHGRAGGPPPPADAAPPRPMDPGTALLLDHTLPDQTTALLQSAIVGFGAGHFYAQDRRAGWIHLGLQAGGLGLYGLTAIIAGSALSADGGHSAHIIGDLGLALSIGSRLVDTATAPKAASDEARRQIERQLRGD